MQIVIWLLLAYHGAILLSVSNASVDSDDYNGKNIERTSIDSNGVRFQKILSRKKRFLLFPPGSAIVTTMSYTKTLVPRSPSGINMIGEYDIFYPLQTKIEDWYPTKKPLPPKKPPPEPEENDENGNDDDSAKGVLPNNIGPIVPQNVPYQTPSNLPIDAIIEQNSQGFLPTPVNHLDDASRLPSDQELGITPATLTSDPNFNIGSHPGEIYVDNKSSPKDPPRRSDIAYYQQLLQAKSYYKRYPYSNLSVRPKFTSYKEPSYENGILKSWRIDSLPSNELYYDNNVRQTYTNRQFFSEADVMNERIRYSRAARERRDIFQQLESSISFKQFDTKSCILRMICETKHYLLPPGKSLFQDIFRILFTLPVENEYEDEYTKATKASELDCNKVYSKRCQYSILGYFMSKDRPIL